MSASVTDAGTATFAEPGRFRAEVYVSASNRRLRVLGYEATDLRAMVGRLAEAATERGFGKVFLKARARDREGLEAAGMECEAVISGFFDGEDAAVMALFPDPERRRRPHAAEEDEILESIRSRPASSRLRPLPEGYECRLAEPADAPELADLYRTVFASYPFPITDPAYLVRTMESHVVYRIIRDGAGQLVAAASAETMPELANSEMTDFATLPSQRGLSLARRLLRDLESEMPRRGINHLYTIARARSAGMNRVFYNQGYRFTGTLVNNCHISGAFEDMHVWCKRAEA